MVALYQVIGYRNTIKHSVNDKFVLKAIEVGGLKEILPLIDCHSELLYFPSDEVIERLVDHAKTLELEEGLKPLNDAFKKRHFINKPEWYASDLVEAAYANGDKELTLQAYAEVMDYDDSGLREDSVWKVLDSLNYEKGFDMFLF